MLPSTPSKEVEGLRVFLPFIAYLLNYSHTYLSIILSLIVKGLCKLHLQVIGMVGCVVCSVFVRCLLWGWLVVGLGFVYGLRGMHH